MMVQAMWVNTRQQANWVLVLTLSAASANEPHAFADTVRRAGRAAAPRTAYIVRAHVCGPSVVLMAGHQAGIIGEAGAQTTDAATK